MKQHKWTAFAVLACVLCSIGVLGAGCGSSDTIAEIIDDAQATALRYTLKTKEEGLILGEDGVPLHSSGSSALTGTIDLDSEETTIDSGSKLTVEFGEGSLGSVVLTVTVTIKFPKDSEFPTAGAIEVTSSEFEGHATITVDNEIPGVIIEVDADGDGTLESSNSYNWDELDDLDDSGEDLAAVAAAAFEVIDLLRQQVDLLSMLLDEINDRSDDLSAEGESITQDCDVMPQELEDRDNPGSYELSLSSDAGDDGVGAGDDFLVAFDDCYDAEDETSGLLLHGALELNGYIRETNAADVLTKFGFERICFDELLNLEFEFGVDSLRTIGITLNGGFSLVFELE